MKNRRFLALILALVLSVSLAASPLAADALPEAPAQKLTQADRSGPAVQTADGEDAIDWEGSGTKDAPYQIVDEAGLRALSAAVSAGESYEGVYFRLTKDITLTGRFTPIGAAQSTPFSGIFDGSGRGIYGLAPENSEKALGLFGWTDGAQIRNLSVYGKFSASGGRCGLVASAADTKIENCTSDLQISVSGASLAGGIAGYMTGGSIRESLFTGSITGTCSSSGDLSSDAKLGGIAGFVNGSGVIESCAGIGTITNASSDISQPQVCLGGIAGYLGDADAQGDTAVVRACYFAGTLSAGKDRAGGITAFARKNWTLENCYAAGSVASGGTVQAVCGTLNAAFGRMINCYYLDTLPADANAEARTDAQMKAPAFVTALDPTATEEKTYRGTYFSLAADAYPELSWRAGAVSITTLFVSPTDAALTIDGKPQTAQSSGTYKLFGLSGTHTYRAEKTGYYAAEGSFRAGATVYITLDQDRRVPASPSQPLCGDRNTGKPNCIRAGGTYTLAADATGTVYLETTEPVTIVGRGTQAADAFRELTIKSGIAGADLTIRNLFIRNTEGDSAAGTASMGNSALDFTGAGNRLTLSGRNLLEGDAYVRSAVIHVGKGSGLTITGGAADVLYLYKTTQGSGIGGNADEACGRLTFAGGALYLKGSQTGAVVGGDASDGTKNDPITVSGGALNIAAKAQGAAIGASKHGSCAGDVYLTGGTLTVTVDYNASSVGFGGEKNGSAGRLIVSGGSFKNVITANGASVWGREGITDAAVTAAKQNTQGRTVSLAHIPTSDFSGTRFTVTVDGAPFYSGWLHTASYQENSASTAANWVSSGDDSFYLYLTQTDHEMTISDGTEERTYDVLWNAAQKTFLVQQTGKTYHTVTFSGEHVSAYVDGTARKSAAVEHGQDLQFTVRADSGYTVDAVTLQSGAQAVLRRDQDTYTLSALEEDVTVELTAKPDVYRVQFALTPEDAVLTLKESDDSIVRPTGGSYALTYGQTYGYEVSAKGYETKKDTLRIGTDITGDRLGDNAFQIKLSKAGAGDVIWDGTSVSADWEGSGTASDPYLIQSAAELAGLAAETNKAGDGGSAFTGKYFRLTADLDLNSHPWTSIGGGDAKCGFGGTFDGDGHVVSNLYIYSTANWQAYTGRNRGLFGILDAGAVVRDLGVDGYVYAQRSVGGIAGKSSGTITGCYNAASIYATDSKGVGGIVGANYNHAVVSYCYNVGSVTSGYARGSAGGIAGENENAVIGCYNAAEVTSPFNAGGIMGSDKHEDSYGTGKAQNCYFLNYTVNGAPAKGVGFGGSDTQSIYGIGSQKLKKIPSGLGGQFTSDSSGINHGYPVFSWQTRSVGGDPILNAKDAEGGTLIESETSISGSRATVKADEQSFLSAANAADAKTTLSILMDTQSAANITEVVLQMPVSGVRAAAAAGAALEYTANLAQLGFSAAALSELASNASGQTITVTLIRRDASDYQSRLSEAERNNTQPLELKIDCGGKAVTELTNASLTIRIPVTDKAFEKGKSYTVILLREGADRMVLSGTCTELEGERCLSITTKYAGVFVPQAEALTLPFTDVPADAYYYPAVAWAVSAGVTKGTSETTFSPDKPCTRAEVLTFLWRAAGSPKAKNQEAGFTDVQKDAYYYDALLWGVENGIAKGTGEGKFSPGDTVSRAQMLTFFYRYAKEPETSGISPFSDVKPGSYYFEAVVWAAEKSITLGTSKTAFSPNASCTRAQSVTLLFRYLVGA